jgi:hypothetical protein
MLPNHVPKMLPNRVPEQSISPFSGDLMAALASPDLEPIFWPPTRTGMMSAWWGHVPFAHWLVTALRPGLIVELGTQNGVSFSSFCEAMHRGHIVGRCFAIDTWKGDKQAGFYDDTVYQNLFGFIQSRYGAFAELVRLSFDEALPGFDEGSIDLLHIDGLHTYEAAKSDFENWLPKLSDRAVVLFHDTNVRQGDFGVWKLWDDIRQRYPSFEFLHGYGLGVAAVGKNVPKPVVKLCEMEEAMRYVIQGRFAQLGARWIAADSADQVSAIYRSTSWRLTKPLRAIKKSWQTFIKTLGDISRKPV